MVVPELFSSVEMKVGYGVDPYTLDLINLKEVGQGTNIRWVPPAILSVITTSLHQPGWEGESARHLDTGFAEYVLRGIREGFRVGFQYHNRQLCPSKAQLEVSRGEPPGSGGLPGEGTG